MEMWHCFIGEPARADIIDVLSRARLPYQACESPPPNGPGIIFFSEINPRLLELLRTTSRQGTERVLAISLSQSVMKSSGIWDLLRAGASDVFAWDQSQQPVAEIDAKFEHWAKIDVIIQSPLVQRNLVGQSAAWIHALRQVIQVAKFTDSSVLLTGDSGTGKELFAQLVHTLDTRQNKGSLVVCDCTTIVPDLSGSEFFGHERGAFTGAMASRTGAFALADGGTLFLDELGELPLTLQAELLRVIQERTYKRVGGNSWNKTNFRLVCATNRNLIEEQSHRRFRLDFYYRIASWTCRLPSLEERREDILVLAEHFIAQLRPDNPPEMDDLVRLYLLQRKYPGNVRDLKQLVTRMVHNHVGSGPITVGDVPQEERPCDDDTPGEWHEDRLQTAVRSAILSGASLKDIERTAGELAERIVLEEEQGNLQRAAARLGVTDRALQMRRAARRSNGNH